jgi:DNA-binding MarR family transcriptional regulator
MSDTIEPKLVELVALLTRKVAELQSAVVKEAGFSDLSLRQIMYLEVIELLHNPTPTELARQLRISKPSVTAAIDRLESVGYLRKVDSDEDRRSYHLHLTQKGQLFSQAHDETHRHLAQFITRNLNKDEVQQLAQLVSKIFTA